MTWASRAAADLLPLSRSTVLAAALNEWFYTGDAFDLEAPEGHCQLCDHPEIRYQFLIRNRHTASELLVGSECINRFGIHALTAEGAVLNAVASRAKVKGDRSKLISDAKKRRAINSLVALLAKDGTFDIQSFINYVQDRGAFTPKQLSLLLWRFEKHAVQYFPTDFKVTIRRDREKEQLRSMPDWQLLKILPALSSPQRAFLRRHGLHATLS